MIFMIGPGLSTCPHPLGTCPLFVVAPAYAVLVDRFVEQPLRPAEFIELRQRAESLQKEQSARYGLGEIIADRRATWDIDHRQPVGTAVIFAEKIHHAH